MTGSIDHADADARSAPRITSHPFALAVCLAALAGFVDATGFIAFNGLFVSFMSGNSTKGAVYAAGADTMVLEVARAIGTFVVGVVGGELVGGLSKRWGQPSVLLLEALLLAGAAAGCHFGQGAFVVASLLGLAMGVQNASVHKADGISVPLTYVTGTLVHAGRGVAHALTGKGPWSAVVPYVALWVGLVSGGIGGALVASRSQFVAMITAAGIATLLLVWTSVRAGLAAENAS